MNSSTTGIQSTRGFSLRRPDGANRGQWPTRPRTRGSLGFTRGPQQAASSQAKDQEKPTWKMSPTHGETKPRNNRRRRSNRLPRHKIERIN